jgi:hypothetical protein
VNSSTCAQNVMEPMNHDNADDVFFVNSADDVVASDQTCDT